MVEALSTSETSVNFHKTSQGNIPEDSHLLKITKYLGHDKKKEIIITRLKVENNTWDL
jgi:hypothetical protein